MPKAAAMPQIKALGKTAALTLPLTIGSATWPSVPSPEFYVCSTPCARLAAGILIRRAHGDSDHYGEDHALDCLCEIAGRIRMKAPVPYMHQKSYAIGGRILRSGSANLSASGLKQQDNDVVRRKRSRGSLRADVGGCALRRHRE